MAKSNSGSGCLIFGIFVLVCVPIVFSVLGFLFGTALAVGAAGYSAWRIYNLWQNYLKARDGNALRTQFGEVLREQQRRSQQALRKAMDQWQVIQDSRGVGTQLEQAFYSGQVDPESRQLVTEINKILIDAENLQSKIAVPLSQVGAVQRLYELHQADQLTLRLDHYRRQINGEF
ncbi:hypothetical protein GP475_09910 [Corynebacterium poyangense]|uniref:Uncharacterized protein n=1 Tax=Corynebacterium poyangense TaxID=2684405 RepID=A0A7H0SQU0_9CORY|nr:hypothetical protein [Corynebacterium poyangense]MBZ8178202.1 hypothetical protein [Corynebacterium poyangense]QNQ90915.1 hypothetical protein GP475_09910 [Corynebacterium poyangense]